MKIPVSLILLALIGVVSFARADGFSLAWSIEHEPHVVLRLTPEQVATVGMSRRLDLTDEQHEGLSRLSKTVPRKLGVESLNEPDCSCHISSVMWTATNEVTIWTERLKGDTDGSKNYYECRSQRGLFTMNAAGDIFAAGKLVEWSAFEAAVMKATDDDYIQLSLPPNCPKAIEERIEALRKKKNFHHRL